MSSPTDRLSAALGSSYRFERELGAGGMATVYLAHDLKHDRDVAIKVLHPELGAALGSERFLSEIRTTARLQHPHILPLLDSGEADGLLYYVMPLATGETLREKLARERQLPIDEAVKVAREVADALGHAHALGIIHRDIKPENILLQGGHALVADFGIALAVQHAGGARMTQTGLSLGTPQYMSPEQATGERTIDARSDVYALGAVTYEMLTGEPPFTGATIQQVVARLMSEEPRALVSQRKAVPDYIEAAVLKALEKLPADRFASATEFGAALEGRTTTLRLTTARQTTASARALTVFLGLLALASTGVAAWSLTRPRPVPEVVRYGMVIDSVPAVREWSGELAISPDGSVIVRTGGPNGVLIMRRRDELTFTPIAGTEGAAGPLFSPDGTQLAYYAANRIMAVALAGGPPVALADSLVTQETAVWSTDGYLYRSKLDGSFMALGRSQSRPGSALQRISTVDTAAGELSHLFPEPLPDGKALLFEVENFRSGKRMIALLDLETGKHTMLFDGVRARYSPTGHVLYTTSDGKLWAVPFDVSGRRVSGTPMLVADRIPTTIVGPVDFAISASGTLVYSVADASLRRELVWVTRSGLRTPLDSTWKGEFSSPSLSPDGSRVAVSLREGAQTHIWLAPATGGARNKLTLENRSSVEPAWTADARWVSYLTGSASSTGDVWRQPSDGSGRAEQVLHGDRPFSEQQWAKDGTLIVRTTTPTRGSGDILRAHPASDTVISPIIATDRAEYSPAVSPDGRWLAYVSNESGRFEVYVTPFDNPGAAKWPVSVAGGYAPRWSHKGDELFYLDLRTKLVAARVATVPTFVVQNTRELFDASHFIQVSLSRRNYDVAPDDQRFLMVQRADGATSGQIVVVEHWADEIRTREKK